MTPEEQQIVLDAECRWHRRVYSVMRHEGRWMIAFERDQSPDLDYVAAWRWADTGEWVYEVNGPRTSRPGRYRPWI